MPRSGSVNKLGGRRVVWEGFPEKVAFGEGPKGGRERGKRGEPCREVGEGQPAQTPQVEILGSKSLQAINAGEGVEKREPSCTVGGNAN